MNRHNILRVIVALAATSTAVADDSSVGVSDTAAPAAASAGADTDNMADFRAVVAAVFAPDASTASGEATGENDSAAAALALVQRNLGTGFGHGTGNAGARPPVATRGRDGADSLAADPGAVFALPYRDSCTANGHLSQSAGVNANNNGFGSGDCGDPSPAD